MHKAELLEEDYMYPHRWKYCQPLDDAFPFRGEEGVIRQGATLVAQGVSPSGIRMVGLVGWSRVVTGAVNHADGNTHRIFLFDVTFRGYHCKR